MVSVPYTIPKFSYPEINAVNDLLANPEKFISEEYSKKCRQYLENYYNRSVLLTHSCTAALEMSALLLNLKPGDEVIIPSYTFVSTANAFALFGAKPVFVDVDEHTLNMDVSNIEALISPRTKAIIPMHYAAIACEMKQMNEIANKYGILVLEDAAQCIGAQYQNKHLGTLGHLGALSFHYTKNLTGGFGGALIINDEAMLARAKIIWQKGTNREAFIEGFVDKYTWQDLGSSYMMSELNAALLYGQLSRLEEITKRRLKIWHQYHDSLRELENNYGFRRPLVPDFCKHNGHIYYLLAPNERMAMTLRRYLAEKGIATPFHYIPLHLSPAGQRFSGNQKPLPVCEKMYKLVVRLPIWEGIEGNIPKIVDLIYQMAAESHVSV